MSDAGSSTRRRPSPALSAGVVLVLLAAAAVIVLLAALTAVIPGTALLGATMSPVVVTVWGPLLLVLGLVTALVAWLLRRAHPRLAAAATIVTAAAVVGALALAGAVGAVVAATLGAGGSVDPLRAITLTGGTGGAPDERPVYLTTPTGQELHLAVTRPRGATGPAPVFVWVHGGGWATGSELDRAGDLRRLAETGWLVVSVEYTLSAPGRPTWDVAGPQVACALAHVAERADDYGGDARRLVLAGDSAGGQLATTVGHRAASGTQASACSTSVPVPRAVATLYPAVDPADMYRRGEGAQEFAAAYTGGTPAQVPERYRAVAGVAAITPAAPPTLVVLPVRDRLVPPAGAQRFVDAARAAGVAAERVDVPFADHIFDLGPAGSLGHQAAWSVLAHWADAQVSG